MVMATSRTRRSTSEQQGGDGDEGEHAGLDEGADDRAAALLDADRRAGGVRRDLTDGA